MKSFKLIGLSCLALALVACSSNTPDPAQEFKGQSAEQIFQGAETALAKHEYKTAINNFEGLDALYPFNSNAEQARLDEIYAYFKNDDMASAGAVADRFIQLYPTSEHVDYAYYMRGLTAFYPDRGFVSRYVSTDLSLRDLTNVDQAFKDFTALLERYPDSVYAPDARSRMVYLRNLMAKHDLQVAQYYYVRKAYVAAANRASDVIDRYQHSPSVVDALVLLVNSYQKLHLTKLANNSFQVLQASYPDSPQYKQLVKANPGLLK